MHFKVDCCCILQGFVFEIGRRALNCSSGVIKKSGRISSGKKEGGTSGSSVNTNNAGANSDANDQGLNSGASTSGGDGDNAGNADGAGVGGSSSKDEL